VPLCRGGWTLSGRDSTFDCRWLEFRSSETADYAASMARVGFHGSFGMAGLGARRKWTVVTVGFPDGDAVMEFRTEVQTMRARMKKAVDACPELEGRIEYGPPRLKLSSQRPLLHLPRPRLTMRSTGLNV